MTDSLVFTARRSLEPIHASERIQVIDILRGFAIFGILLVNMQLFSHTLYAQITGISPPSGLVDQAASWLIRLLGYGKFYSLFAFLFGFGLAMQMARAEARGRRFVPTFVRRLLVLLAIGLIHATLFWIGDILVTYAVLGFVLLLFRKCRPKTLLIWAVALLLFMLVVNGALLGLTVLAHSTPGGSAALDRQYAQMGESYREADRQATLAYAEGNFADITRQRIQDLGVIYPSLLYGAPNVMAMFLLGLAAGKAGLFQKLPASLPFFRRLCAWGLLLGLPLNLVFAAASQMSISYQVSLAGFFSLCAQTLGAPLLSLGYLAGIVLLVQQTQWRRRLAPLAPVGRMALSNYLLQTVICTLIFYGYGLGLFGRTGTAVGLLLTVGIYAIQVPLSNLWLAHFQFGPLEWLWRTLTYGRSQPMRLPDGQVQGVV